MAAHHQSLPHEPPSWRAHALIVCAAVLSLIGTFHISRWLLEGARWEMVIAWIFTGALMLAMLFFLILLTAFIGVMEIGGNDPSR